MGTVACRFVEIHSEKVEFYLRSSKMHATREVCPNIRTPAIQKESPYVVSYREACPNIRTPVIPIFAGCFCLSRRAHISDYKLLSCAVVPLAGRRNGELS